MGLVRDIAHESAMESDSQQASILSAGFAKIAPLVVDPSPRMIEEIATIIGTAQIAVANESLAIARDLTVTPDVRALASVTSAVAFRRLRQPQRSLDAITALKSSGSKWIFINSLGVHLQALTYIGQIPSGLDIGLKLSKQAAEEMPDNSGARHAYANFLLEKAIWQTDSHAVSRELLETALNEVETALAISEWPKFHFTRGRILLRLALDERARNEGLRDLERAILSEERNSIDFQERMLTYTLERSLAELRREVHLAKIEILKQETEVYKEYDEKRRIAESEFKDTLQAESRRMQGQMITILAFVTSVFAVVQFAGGVFGLLEKLQGKNLMWHSLMAMGAISIILFGATFLGAWFVNRSFRATAK